MTRVDLARKLAGEGKTPEEIAQEFGINVRTVRRYLRNRVSPRRSQPRPSSRPILVFGDVHAPYHHPDAIEFLKHVHSKYRCLPHVYCTGDLFDFHSMSRHLKELDSPSPDEEYERAKEFSAELSTVFPQGTLVLGNHDTIPQRQMLTLGVSAKLLKSYNVLLNLPDTWTIESVYTTAKDTVLIEHGLGSCGINGAINTGLAKQCNYIQGHSHAFAGVSFRASVFNLRWAMNVGCLLDHSSLAARYGMYAKNRGVLGCGLVYPASKFIAGHGVFIPMNT